MVSGTAVEESLVRTAGLTTMLTHRSPSAGDGIAGAAQLGFWELLVRLVSPKIF